ncbi:histidine kinase [Actinoplanes sp. NPDC023714]|uniref:sensor histidine kinase n=1 Tax=Actinoplanes sp. NPDC023714 TaxID=3154322 RepID=UPI0033F1D723
MGGRRRGFTLVAAHTAWLWFLLPAAGAAAGNPVAIAGLIVFVLLYLALVAIPVAGLPVGRGPQHAGLALLALIGIGLAAAYAGDWLTVFLYVCTAGTIGLSHPSRAFAWAGGSVLAVLVIGAAHHLPAGEIAPTALFTALAGASSIAFVRFVRLVEELRRTQEELARTVVERERLRFAQDLHDLLGHTLSLIVVKAEVVRRLAPSDGERAAVEAADIERIGRTALAEVREAVTGYRASDFAGELENARAVLADAGIAVRVREDGRPVDDAFRWVLREGVTNVLRHSRATRCDIIVGTGTLTIADDGVGGAGADFTGPGNGLRGLTERLSAAGGTLVAGPSAGGGWELTARIPA